MPVVSQSLFRPASATSVSLRAQAAQLGMGSGPVSVRAIWSALDDRYVQGNSPSNLRQWHNGFGPILRTRLLSNGEVVLQVTWFHNDATKQPPQLQADLLNAELERISVLGLAGTWKKVGSPNPLNGHTWVADHALLNPDGASLGGLPRGEQLVIRVWAADNPRRTRRVTFRLPSRRLGDGDTIRIAFGSCYDARTDLHHTRDRLTGDGILGDAVRRHRVQSGTSLDAFLLLGDQIYVDQPVHDFRRPEMDYDTIRHRFYARTRESMLGQRSIGENSLTYTLSDDHEYWNDFPEKPPFVAWPSLNLSSRMRRRWRAIGRLHARKVQRIRNLELLEFGPIGLALLDTRISRIQGNSRFCKREDMNLLGEWLRNRNGPAVLAIGGPLHTNRVSKYFGVTSDRHLPHFDQFHVLLSWILSCPHDVVVVAGDPHWSRLSRAVVKKNRGADEQQVFEVISSPLAALESARGNYRLSNESLRLFPPNIDKIAGVVVDSPSPVEFLAASPRYQLVYPNGELRKLQAQGYWGESLAGLLADLRPDDNQRTMANQESFMSLTFRSDSGAIKMRVEGFAFYPRRNALGVPRTNSSSLNKFCDHEFTLW